MTARNEVVKYLIDEYYHGKPALAAKIIKAQTKHVQLWLDGTRTPQKSNVDKLIFYAMVPKFKPIVEYYFLRRSSRPLKKRISTALAGHKKDSGLYAFYDSMANLIYVGKSNGNLLGEICQALNAKLPAGTLPKTVVGATTRYDVVRYISAYSVQASDHEDYARHVESLILRISKPRLNKIAGKLA